MGIETFIKQVCKQTAVYWGSPVSNGYGGYTYDDPVEIDCRWAKEQQLFESDNGIQLVSKAVVLLTEDVDMDGLLYLGTLDEMWASLAGDSLPLLNENGNALLAEDDTPLLAENEIPGSIEEELAIIKKFTKVPALRSTTEFVRKAYLTGWQG